MIITSSSSHVESQISVNKLDQKGIRSYEDSYGKKDPKVEEKKGKGLKMIESGDSYSDDLDDQKAKSDKKKTKSKSTKKEKKVKNEKKKKRNSSADDSELRSDFDEDSQESS